MDLIFNGVSALSKGIRVWGSTKKSVPERDLKEMELPVVSGELIIDNDRFKTYEVKYKISTITTREMLETGAITGRYNPSDQKFYNASSQLISGQYGKVYKDTETGKLYRYKDSTSGTFSPVNYYQESLNNLMAWLYPINGYLKLHDTNEPSGTYRMAIAASSANIENWDNQAGVGEIVFKVQPGLRNNTASWQRLIFTSQSSQLHTATFVSTATMKRYPLLKFLGPSMNWAEAARGLRGLSGYLVITANGEPTQRIGIKQNDDFWDESDDEIHRGLIVDCKRLLSYRCRTTLSPENNAEKWLTTIYDGKDYDPYIYIPPNKTITFTWASEFPLVDNDTYGNTGLWMKFEETGDL